jgi:hypothetical protein
MSQQVIDISDRTEHGLATITRNGCSHICLKFKSNAPLAIRVYHKSKDDIRCTFQMTEKAGFFPTKGYVMYCIEFKDNIMKITAEIDPYLALFVPVTSKSTVKFDLERIRQD